MRFLLLAVPCLLAACDSGPCGLVMVQWGNTAGLDISGASNTPCTVTVTRESTSLVFQVASPSPAVDDTSLDERAPVSSCAGVDAGVAVDVTPEGQAIAARTSTQLCFTLDGSALGPFGNISGTDCSATLTLTCAGTTLYDQVPWQLCRPEIAC